MKPNLKGRLAAISVTACWPPLAVFAPFAVLAASDPGCTALGGVDGAGTCDVSAPVGVSGTITVNENLHLLAGAVLTVNSSPFTLNVTGNLEMDGTSKIDGSGAPTGDDLFIDVSGDMTMHGGATITSAGTGFGDEGGDIHIDVGNYPNSPPVGVFTMETGSLVDASANNSGDAGDIHVTAGKSATIDGQILAEVLSGSTGNGGFDGGAIFVDTGCGLDVGGTISSYGRDQGADLVHLSSCKVEISGFVRSSGEGHGIPHLPIGSFNHCAHTFRPDKPDNATGCVEVWANIIKITNTGEIESDINKSGFGGSEGSSWIDLFAWKKMDIDGRTGATDRFAVHANSYSGSDHTTNTVTAKVINGAFTGGGKLFSASDSTGNGSYGGAVVIEAYGAVVLDTGTVMAAGDNVGGGSGNPPPCDGGAGACGAGGTIAVRSFNAGISWQNGVGDVNPDRQPSANAGTISLTACTAINVTNTNFDDATPSQTSGVCGGAPQVADYVVFRHDLWLACAPITITGLKFNDLDNNNQNDSEPGLPDWVIHITGPNSFDTTVQNRPTAAWSLVLPGPGSYTVCEVLQAGWAQTFPQAGVGTTACASGEGPVGYLFDTTSVNLCCEPVTVDDFDFGNHLTERQHHNKSGYKFNDLNGNHAWDANQPGLNGWTITVWDSTQTNIEFQDVTHNNPSNNDPGYYEFALLDGVTYVV